MIYLTSLALCLFLTVIYDILGYTKNKWHWYYILLLLFIAVSGLQYMVGTDITEYIYEYKHFYNELRFDVGDVDGMRQPGWVLLCYVCRQITNDITLLKLIQAIFVNVSIFHFFKREAKYVFLCLTFYALSSYLLLNFNVLRQSISLGFALYSISYYKRKKYIISLLFLFGAYMFHNSALVLLAIPIFGLLNYNKYLLYILSLMSLILIYLLFKIDMNLIFDFVFDEFMDDGVFELGQSYVNSDRLGLQETKMGFVTLFRVFMILSVVMYYMWKYKDVYFGGMGLLYLFLLVFSFILPIIFRFGTFYEIPFYVILSTVVIEYPKNRLRQVKYMFYICVFAVYSYFPYKDYSRKYIGSDYCYIDQYYPYHSVLEPDVEENVDHKKLQFFKNFRIK